MPRDAIQLLDPRQRTAISAANVYFAFASGRLAYDCVTCGATCCRGHGYLVNSGDELKPQLARRALPLFVAQTDDTVQYRFGNCAPGCFFLTADGLCEVQKDHGYRAKPETCRLFPFNNIRRSGPFLIVQPHQSLCPLDVVDGAATSICSDHGTLLSAMADQGIAARLPGSSVATQDMASLIRIERKIVALSEQHLHTPVFELFARGQVMVERATDEDALNAMKGLPSIARELLGLTEESDACPQVARVVIASVPFLRAQYLFRDDTHRNGASPIPFDTSRLAHTTYVVYLIARAAATAGMKRITFQTIAQIEREFRPVIQLVALWDRVLVWQAGAPIDLAFIEKTPFAAAALRFLQQLLPAIQAKRRVPLGDLLRSCMPADPMQRIVFLRRIGQLLAGRLVPLERARATLYRAGLNIRLRSAVQHWAFAQFQPELLLAAYSRRARSASQVQ